MTIKEFSEREHVSVATVRKWVRNGWIPGARIEDSFVPNSARKPYTGARARTTKSIYKSILTAINERLQIFPWCYHITDAEFNQYINSLINNGVIQIRIEDGITYYDLAYQERKLSAKDITAIISNIVTPLFTVGGIFLQRI